MTRRPRLILAVGLVSILVGIAYASARARREGGAIRFVPDVVRFEAPLEGVKEYALTAALENGSGRSVTLRGAPEICEPTGCVKIEGLPLVVPAGTVGRVSIRLETGSPGPFDHAVAVYTDDRDLPDAVLHLIGTVAGARAEGR